MDNVLVYMDYENIHTILRKEYSNILENGFFEKFEKFCENEELRVLEFIAYSNYDLDDLAQSFHQTKLQEYGIETRHTFNKGKNFADMQISVDAIEQAFKNNVVDGFIIISSDKDMIPLIKSLKKNSQFVYLITTKNDCDENIFEFPDKHIILDEILSLEAELKINKVYEKVYEGLNEFIAKKLKNFKADKSGDPKFAHIEFDYYVSSTSSWHRVFEYTVANICKYYEDKQEVFTYKYSRGHSEYLGITTKDYLEEFKALGIIKEEEILKNAIDVKPFYDKYIPKEKI